MISLYTLVPFVVFFNLDRVHLTADLAGGLVIGWVAILAAIGLAWIVGNPAAAAGAPGAPGLADLGDR